MYGEIYALITAILRGFSAIPTRKGLQYSNPNTSAIFYLTINTILLWSMTFSLYSVDQLAISGLQYFVLAGLLAPGIARIFRDIGFQRLGVTIASPIIGANTLFSMILAVLFLRENATIFLFLGAILIFIGLNIITWQEQTGIKWKKKDLIYPIIAAFLFASSTNIRKIGLLETGFPLIGAAITSSVSATVILFSIIISRARNSEKWMLKINKQSAKYFVISGFSSSIAYLFYFFALSSTYLVKIQPIAGSNPLFTILFSHLFLKDIEKVTLKVVVSTVLVVLGIILVTA